LMLIGQLHGQSLTNIYSGVICYLIYFGSNNTRMEKYTQHEDTNQEKRKGHKTTLNVADMHTLLTVKNNGLLCNNYTIILNMLQCWQYKHIIQESYYSNIIMLSLIILHIIFIIYSKIKKYIYTETFFTYTYSRSKRYGIQKIHRHQTGTLSRSNIFVKIVSDQIKKLYHIISYKFNKIIRSIFILLSV